MINYRKTIIAKVKFNPKAIVVDFDDTIAEWAPFPKIGKPIERVIKKLREIHKRGYVIVISSGRFSDKEHPTKEIASHVKEVKEWLKEHDVPFDEIWPEAKPHGLLYLDDRAVNVNDLGKMDSLLKKTEKSQEHKTMKGVK